MDNQNGDDYFCWNCHKYEKSEGLPKGWFRLGRFELTRHYEKDYNDKVKMSYLVTVGNVGYPFKPIYLCSGECLEKYMILTVNKLNSKFALPYKTEERDNAESNT